ncbi:hypothetical protein, partial [Mesorhizobium sp. CAU 1741]|uniref:hypothetical protein n=1 Tax=Mesorhizobium sp. CAU 1741 TaxID=3140366 RepID=UPI00325C2A75
ADAVTIFRGTVEQVEFSWTDARVLIRDRLAELDVEHQDNLFAGTTISGGMDEAEGTADDLKDRPKPLTYGRPLLAPGVAANRFDNIFGFGADGLDAFEDVRDSGVLLTASGTNHATVAALRGATITAGQYHTCLAEGLLRTGSTPDGELTARPVEKSSSADRTAAQIAKRMLERKGFVEGVNFLAADIAALDTLNDAEIGYFMPPQDATTLVAVQHVLGSIGATIVPDRLGVYRMFRLDPATGFPVLTITTAEALEVSGGRGIQLLRTGDQGKGVPAWRVTVRYGYNWQVFNRNDLDVDTTEAFMAFASQEWREAIAEDEAVKAVHKLASDLVYETYLTQGAAATTEAVRLKDMHSVARDRFLVPVKSYLAEQVELNSVVRLQMPRFGLNAGKDFRVIGISENFKTRVTTLDIWG